MDRWTALAPILYLAKKRFVAGEQRQEAIATAIRLPQRAVPIFNLLGEHAKTLVEIEKTLQEYRALADGCQQLKKPFRISIKPSQVGLYPRRDATPEEWALGTALRVYDATKDLRNFIKQTNASIEIDMEEYATIENTLSIAKALRASLPSSYVLRVAVQARHDRSLHDIARLNSSRVSVRLVKGAYPAPEIPYEQPAHELRVRFLRCADALLQNGTAPAFGTHDEKLVSAIKHKAAKLDIAPSNLEFQFLYGMRPKLRKELLAQGYNIGVYLPYGPLWRAYGLRRWKFFLRNPLELHQYLFR